MVQLETKGIACIVEGVTILNMRRRSKPHRTSTISLSLNMGPFGKAKDMSLDTKEREEHIAEPIEGGRKQMEEIVVKGMVIQGEIGVRGDKIDIKLSGFDEEYRGSSIIIRDADIAPKIRKIIIIAEVGHLPIINLEMYLTGDE